MRRFLLSVPIVMVAVGNPGLLMADSCEASIDRLQRTVGSLLMMAHEAGAFAPNEEQPEIRVKRLATYYTDAKRSLTDAKTTCAEDPKAMDTIHARERDLDKIGATLNVEKPR